MNPNLKKLILTSVVLLVVAAAVFGVWMTTRGNKSTDLVLSGTIETHDIQVGSKVGGRVSQVLVVEGQTVKAGDVLVKFDVAELKAQREQLLAKIAQAEAVVSKLKNGFRVEEVAQAEAAVEREKAVMESLKNGPRPQEIAQARADMAAAQADLENAELSWNRVNRLYQSGDVSKQVLDNAQTRKQAAVERLESLRQRVSLLEAGTRQEDLRAAGERLRQAQENLHMMRSGARKEDIAEATARLNEAQALLEGNAVQLAEGVVTAPVASRVEVLSVRPGDLLPPNKPIAVLLEGDQLWVRVFVPEPELGRVKVGQKASVTIDTFPNRPFSGTVEQISDQAEFLPRNVQSRNERNHQVFGMKVRVDNPENIFKSGMAAEVRLETK